MVKKTETATPERTVHENNLLDMLGEDLGGAVLAAQDRLGDRTVMARVGGHDRDKPQPGVVHVERGMPPEIVMYGLSEEEAVECLASLA